MSTELIFYYHPWLFGLGFVLCMLAAVEAGFRLGRKATVQSDQRATVQAVETAILGVLALLLGFTMSMAVSRFEARRLLILQEANAIGTSDLRSRLVPAPEGLEINHLVRQYLDARTRYFTSDGDGDTLRAIHTSTEQLQTAIWGHVNTLVQKDSHSIPAGLLVQSINEMFDLQTASRAAARSHVPATVISLNAVVSLFTAMFVGYTFGLGRQRHIFSAIMLAIAIAAVLAVILDLDEVHGGFIHVNPQPMIDLQESWSPANH
jgi:uncharacterized membrane protein